MEVSFINNDNVQTLPHINASDLLSKVKHFLCDSGLVDDTAPYKVVLEKDEPYKNGVKFTIGVYTGQQQTKESFYFEAVL